MEERTINARAELEKAEQAQALMTNPVVTEIFERLERDYIAAWRGSAPQHGDERESAYFRLQALDAFRRDIQSIIDGGRIAEQTIRRSTRPRF